MLVDRGIEILSLCAMNQCQWQHKRAPKRTSSLFPASSTHAPSLALNFKYGIPARESNE
jgi:hypothetical protein